MSRLFSAIAAMASAFASAEMKAAEPYVVKAIQNLPNDVKANDPIQATVSTLKNAYDDMRKDPNVVPSFTGLIGCVAAAALAGWNVFAGSGSPATFAGDISHSQGFVAKPGEEDGA